MKRRQALKHVAMLLGGILSTPTIMAMENYHFSEIYASDFKLNAFQKKIVAEVAELIIPRTKTAGAKDTGVPAFIEMMMKDCYPIQEKTNFLNSLNALQKQDFLTMSINDKIKTLAALEAETKIIIQNRNVKQTKIGDNEDKELMDNQNKGVPFWRLMKELTLLGYFTSERGITENFDYNQVPGKLEVVKWVKGQKAFAY